jgi:transaldolase / glucose-6-phosphate isomerase
MNRLQELHEAGVSIWLDTIRRKLVASGDFRRMIEDEAVTGVTSNPSIFEKAISGSNDYDEHIRELLAEGTEDAVDLFFALGLEDIRLAADALRPAFDGSDGRDGFGSFEVTPDLAHDSDRTVEQALTLWGRLDRPNVMIKVPGTEEGIPAIEELTAAGVNVNVTLLFSVRRYEQAANAYLAGLERRVDAGQPVDAIASVASFFVSRVDTAVDRLLPVDSPLRGTVAVANARHAYRRFGELFSGDRWERLVASGARVQRPLWASTGTKNPAYSDVLYVEELIAPECINTMPESTLLAFQDHGRVRPTIEPNLADADRVLAEAAGAGIDMDAVTQQLLDEGVELFADAYRKLVGVIEGKVEAIREERVRQAAHLDGLEGAVQARLGEDAEADVVPRIWRKDFTVWRQDPTEITDRLGWLTVHEVMQERIPELKEFAAGCASDGLTDVVLAGMGGSSLAPEVLRATFGVAPGMLDVHVLDTTNPDQILAVERTLDLEKTLFVIASKSGTTTETQSHLKYFWEKVPDGSHFVAITDPGTPLDHQCRDLGFRQNFLNPADIGGRYSALSYFGLVHGALIGMDLEGLLDRAVEMAHACASCVRPGENPGAWLGAVMGEAGRAGRDKVTLVLDERVRTFGYWVEQLIAESTGKEGRGLVPVEGEDVGPPDVYGEDRLFVGVGTDEALRPGLEPLEHAGHPAVLLRLEDPIELGGEFFRWEFATAVAGHVLGIHPFDQPNVQEAKDATKKLLASGDVTPPPYDDAGALLKEVRAGDYIAILAYMPRNDENERRLHAARMGLRDRFRVATTVGFGPRFLHSTGQLHKGGPDTGVFLQVVEAPSEDVAIPGEPYSFATLFAAQSSGDLASLRAHGRRVARIHLDDLERAAEEGR